MGDLFLRAFTALTLSLLKASPVSVRKENCSGYSMGNHLLSKILSVLC